MMILGMVYSKTNAFCLLGILKEFGSYWMKCNFRVRIEEVSDIDCKSSFCELMHFDREIDCDSYWRFRTNIFDIFIHFLNNIITLQTTTIAD